MKITAIILTYNEQDYIRPCLESIKDICDKIIILDGGSTDGTVSIIHDVLANKDGDFGGGTHLIIDEKRDDYSYLRNKALKNIESGSWVLWIDGDEILAHADGSPVTRKELEKLIRSNMPTHSFNIFTFHFIYNYFTIDGRNDGHHWSIDRLFRYIPIRYPKDKTGFKKELPHFVKPMHEMIDWGLTNPGRKPLGRIIYNEEKKPIQFQKDPIIFHYGHCKGMENLRRKYQQFFRIPFYKAVQEKFKDYNDYCSTHELFKGTRPLIHYYGKHPEVLRLC